MMKLMEEEMKVAEEPTIDFSAYEIISPRRVAYSAQEIAECLQVPGKDLAKVVFVKHGDRFSIGVLPAGREIDLERFKEILRTDDLRLATEDEYRELFPEDQAETTSRFDYLYNIDVYVDDCLTECEEILQFAAIVWPKVAEFCLRD
jgi:prolyl-tRNA editing enzyme YbaK/EbsC (Cys-tRNA(Pro) deacylase)